MVSILDLALQRVSDDYGPSKQVIEWVLVRLQGFSKLFDNVYNKCLEAATYLQWRFQNGHVWSAALIGTAVVSRIWVISQYLVKNCCDWYNQLKMLLPVFQPSLTRWLPDGYNLPDNLILWLNNPDYLIKSKNLNKVLFPFLSNSDEEHSDRKSQDKKTKVDKNIIEKEFFINKNDIERIEEDRINILSHNIGQAVLRDEINEDNSFVITDIKAKIKGANTNIGNNCANNKVSYTSKIESNSVEDIKNRVQLIRFIKKEKLLRASFKINDCTGEVEKNFLTKKLDKLQWRMFQKFIKEKINQIDDSSVTKKIFFKKLRKEIKLWIS